MQLPSGGADRDFGVFHRETRELDQTLTRQLFGACQEELDEFLLAFQKVRMLEELAEGFDAFVTSSNKGHNTCSLTNAFIPEKFPYIRLDESPYLWSHLSLHGFFRLLLLLCPYSHNEYRRGRLFRLLVEAGAKPETIIQLTKAGAGSSGEILDLRHSLDISRNLLRDEK